MDKSLPASQAGPVDTEALATALNSLGLLYGGRAAVAHAAVNAADDAEVVRAYIRSERAHLLSSYPLEDLVALVLAARNGNARAPASIESHSPA